MVDASLLGFARTGALGPIRLGLARDEVESLLGSPPSWLANSSKARSTIWKFEDVEIYFTDHVVTMLFCDAGTLTNGGEALRIDPWVIRRRLSQAAFEKAVVDAGMSFERRPGPVDQVHVVVNGVAVFSFDPDASGTFGLGYWQTDR
ncbi:MAG: hypothetical protein AAGA54_37290 [Myxococcota bacterium]